MPGESGWLPDPQHVRRLRWWDGVTWSDWVREGDVTRRVPFERAGGVQPAEAAHGPARPPGIGVTYRRIAVWVAGVLATLLVLPGLIEPDDRHAAGEPFQRSATAQDSEPDPVVQLPRR